MTPVDLEAAFPRRPAMPMTNLRFRSALVELRFGTRPRVVAKELGYANSMTLRAAMKLYARKRGYSLIGVSVYRRNPRETLSERRKRLATT